MHIYSGSSLFFWLHIAYVSPVDVERFEVVYFYSISLFTNISGSHNARGDDCDAVQIYVCI